MLPPPALPLLLLAVELMSVRQRFCIGQDLYICMGASTKAQRHRPAYMSLDAAIPMPALFLDQPIAVQSCLCLCACSTDPVVGDYFSCEKK